MFGLFRKTSQAKPPEPGPAPVVGIPVRDVVAALAAVDALAIDRRILRVEVVTEGRVKVETGHVTNGLNANVHYLMLEQRSGGWQVVEHDNLVS